jgi:hypothetical protein
MKRLLTFLLVLFIPAIAWGNQGAVILYDHSSVVFYPDGRKVWREEFAVKITGERGIKEFGEVVIPYSHEHQKVKLIYAYTITPEGKKVEPPKEAINEVYPPFSSSAPIYSDLRYKTISMPALSVGSVIKYAYEVETFKPYMKNQFWATNFFQGEFPVIEATFTARIPKGKPYKFKVYNLKDYKFSMEEEKDFVVLKWVVYDLPGIEKEHSMPPMGEVGARVTITSLKSWDEVAKWYAELAREALKPTKLVRETALKVIRESSAKTDYEKAKAIYDFVSKKIRYVGFEFGINGYKPHSAESVLKNRYGDCKDHSTLFISMLRAVGIKSFPVLIPTLEKTNLDVSMPLPTAFNHEIAVVEINGKRIFADTTSEFTPFGRIPSGDQGRKVLIVNDERGTGTISQTPTCSPEENVELFAGNFTLTPSGKLEGEMRFEYRGIYASFQRARLGKSSEKKQRSFVKNLVSQVSPGFSVVNYELKGIDDNYLPVVVKVFGEDANYSLTTKNFILARLPVPAFERLSLLVSEPSRHYDYVVGYRMSKEVKVKVKIPENFEFYLVPENVRFESSVGSFSVKWKVSGNSATVEGLLILKKPRISPEEYEDLKNLFEGFVKVLKNQVLVLKKE